MKNSENEIAGIQPDFSRKIASFDIGVALGLIHNEVFAKRLHSSESIAKEVRETYSHWAEPCKDIIKRCKDTANKLGIPSWELKASSYFGYTDNSPLKKILTEEWGKNTASFYVLGCLIWEVGKAPKRLGYIEKLKNLFINLNLPGEVTNVASSWICLNKENATLEPEEVRTFLNQFRVALMAYLSKPKAQIFISYSQLDIEFVRELVSEFEKGDVKCFLAERDIQKGKFWPEEIRQHLISCDEFLIIVTPRSKSSEWLKIEAGAAWALRKEINIALNFVSPEELPQILKNYQAGNIETIQDRKRFVNELCIRIKARKDS